MILAVLRWLYQWLFHIDAEQGYEPFNDDIEPERTGDPASLRPLPPWRVS